MPDLSEDVGAGRGVYCVPVSLLSAIKRALVGRRLANDELGETLLPNRLALPLFASDALSSVAYAPGEVLVVLSLAGMAAYEFSWQIGILVGLVIAIVVISYRQTVRAYPDGGGDYEVARENFGLKVSLTAAAALLVDYSLTVAVSVAAGVANAASVLPGLGGYEVWICLAVIAALALMNVRGVREAGWFFAWPTYIFISSVILMIVTGLVRILVLGHELRSETADLTVVSDEPSNLAGWALVAILVKAFSSGCAALTGVEAVANGVPVLREPKGRNAARILALLGLLAVTMVVGMLVLARMTGVKQVDERLGSHVVDEAGVMLHDPVPTVMAQLARTVFGGWAPPLFVITISATVVILFMAANTAFAGFPGLASILARDGYLPRQLHTRGDRLSYTNGIVLLAAVAGVLVWWFQGSVTALIQLYVIGVFISFSIGQWGMVRHWNAALRTETDRRTRRQMQQSRIVNVIGVLCTSAVLLIVLVSKFTHGAWISLAAMAFLYVVMRAIHDHYEAVADEVALDDEDRVIPSRVRAVVLVKNVNKPMAKALEYARASRPTSLEALAVGIDDAEVERLQEAWDEHGFDVPLKILASPYREVSTPFVSYVARLRSDNPRDIVAVYIPEYVVGHWYEQFLHNQTALMIRARLHFMSGVMVISVPYQLRSSRKAKERLVAQSAPRKGTWRH